MRIDGLSCREPSGKGHAKARIHSPVRRRRNFAGAALRGRSPAWRASAFLSSAARLVAKNLALASELARIGYVEGRNIAYELCAADGDLSRLPALARELVAAKPDV